MSKNGPSATAADHVGISLHSFFVFNSSLCKREGQEEKKILYYYPTEEDIDRKIKDVGLCEAVSKFTETFAPETPVEAVHTQRKRMLLHQPEPQYWMVLSVTVPYNKGGSSSQQQPQQQQSRKTPVDTDDHHLDRIAGGEQDYLEDDVSDKVLLSVLHHSYMMFKLFMGSFGHIVSTANSGVESLASRLEHFFSRYLLNLRLPSADLLDVFSGIHFLPLDKTTFLRIQCFINAVEEKFPAVKYTAFLYNNLLVWSSLAQVDIRILYSYLTRSLLPSAHLEHELGTALSSVSSPPSQRALVSPLRASPTIHYPVSSSSPASSSPSTPRSASTMSSTTRTYGSFITGGPASSRVPRVFVNTTTPNEECHLVVYRALSATLCLFTEVGFPLTKDFYTELEVYMGEEMARLASDVGEQYTKSLALTQRGTGTSDDQQTNWKYLYFNHMNLAQKTSFHVGKRSGSSGSGGSWGWDWSDWTGSGNQSGPATPPTASPTVAEVLGILSDINTDLGREEGSDGETIVKTYRDQWVVGKKSDEREVYIVIHQKHANLIEINEQLKTLCNSHFSNIFFLD